MEFNNRIKVFFNEHPHITIDMVRSNVILTDKQKVVLEKRFEGLTTREIAKSLDEDITQQSIVNREEWVLKKLYKYSSKLLLDK